MHHPKRLTLNSYNTFTNNATSLISFETFTKYSSVQLRSSRNPARKTYAFIYIFTSYATRVRSMIAARVRVKRRSRRIKCCERRMKKKTKHSGVTLFLLHGALAMIVSQYVRIDCRGNVHRRLTRTYNPHVLTRRSPVPSPWRAHWHSSCCRYRPPRSRGRLVRTVGFGDRDICPPRRK